MTVKAMNLNSKQFKVLGNELFQCEDCLAFTKNPSKHECSPTMMELARKRKPDILEQVFGKLRRE